MPDPMTPERLADRRKEIEAEHVERRYFYGAECSCGECLPCVVLADELAWLDEVERLRAELADTVGEARSDIAGLESLARRLRTAWESARRGRREARAQIKAARPYIDWLHEQRRTLFAERDRLAEQVKDTAAAVAAWENGTTAPHDALAAIRDRATGAAT